MVRWEENAFFPSSPAGFLLVYPQFPPDYKLLRNEGLKSIINHKVNKVK